ncbi:hypothetical protein [Polaromonas sp. A23]|uniref:hypothetical protein n=1 Tax=Polaromonas sp. A23 TaxID=1944133 RepID=UPI000984257D|nr:hypothetical protein [Polaromonas sp. A23]OOG44751.1 hypothetical protein B0B52_06495 [Polaromonas sp. A23]
MGLKADIDEVLVVWARAPWRVRVYLALSLILASTSIASLSETVFKWKGFLRDGVNLYRSAISDPIKAVAQNLLNYSLTQSAFDLVVLAILLAAASFRVAIFQPRGSFGRKGEFAALGAMVGVIVVLIAGNGTPLSLWLAGISMVASFLMNAWFHVRLGGAPALLWFVYVLAPPSLVGLLGAIHSGLTRQA